jgi:hypothetical protein
MRRKFALIGTLAALAMLSISAQLASLRVQAVTAGVQTGNYFGYKVGSASGTSELRGVDNFTITISNVTGSVVNFQEARWYPNGTQINTPGFVDLATGNSSGSWILINANLGVGDPVYPGWPIWPNETVNMNGRPTDHTILNNASNIGGQQGNSTIDIFCDQATGATVNVSAIFTGLQSNSSNSFSYSLIATNVWTIVPEFSPIALAIIMSTLTATTVAIVYRRKTE